MVKADLACVGLILLCHSGVTMFPEFERNVSIGAVLLLLCVVADSGDDYRAAGMLCSCHRFGLELLVISSRQHTYTGQRTYTRCSIFIRRNGMFALTQLMKPTLQSTNLKIDNHLFKMEMELTNFFNKVIHTGETLFQIYQEVLLFSFVFFSLSVCRSPRLFLWSLPNYSTVV